AWHDLHPAAVSIGAPPASPPVGVPAPWAARAAASVARAAARANGRARLTWLLRTITDLVDGAGVIVGEGQQTRRVDGDRHRAHRPLPLAQRAARVGLAEEVVRLGGAARAHAQADDQPSDLAGLAVPRAVRCHEQVAPILRRIGGARVLDH